jgi:hypothetical protein
VRLLTPILTALLVLGALPASASQASGPAIALVRPPVKSRWDADRKNPYSRLFKPGEVQVPLRQPAPAKPEVKCGMTVVPVDPSGYPGIVVPQEPRSTKFTIRAIDPTICR